MFSDKGSVNFARGEESEKYCSDMGSYCLATLTSGIVLLIV